MRPWCLPAVATLSLLVAGCDSGFPEIDREVETLLAETSAELGPPDEAVPARYLIAGESARYDEDDRITDESPPTVNPAAADLKYTAMDDPEQETDAVLERMLAYGRDRTNAIDLDLEGAFAYAIRHSREYKFNEEEYVLAALRLLAEEHRWGPRFFDTITADISSFGDGGTFDSALRVVNDLSVTQRLPYGGDVSARLLATAVEDLHLNVSGENRQTAELIFDADIPLLRGAGTIAREDLIQRRRDIIYAARDFERFRRTFLVSIAQDFLQLVVDQRGILNTRQQVEGLIQLEEREVMLYREGRRPQFQAAVAENATISARDNLNSQFERFRLNVDQFKIRLGMPVEQHLTILDSTPGLSTPTVSMRDAIFAAMQNRLDLQNERDRLADSQRAVENAMNLLLPDLRLTGSLSIPTDPDKDRAGLDFEPKDLSAVAGVTFGLPLDREIERIAVRQAQISLERARRTYDQTRDGIAVDVRQAVRQIDSRLFSVQIQERGVVIAERRKAGLDADPGDTDAQEFSNAEEDLLDARDARDQAKRDLEVAILFYLQDTGQLRVEPDGSIHPLDGMELTPEFRDTPDPATLTPVGSGPDMP
jgi:hypothetical protein